jgi:hypothetical protein
LKPGAFELWVALDSTACTQPHLERDGATHAGGAGAAGHLVARHRGALVVVIQVEFEAANF